MSEKIKKLLSLDFDPQKLNAWLSFALLSVYLVFPIVNLIRRANGGFYFFYTWRDYIFYAALIFVIFLVASAIDNRKKGRTVCEKGFFIQPAFIYLALLALWILISSVVTGFKYETVIGSERSRTGLICSFCYFIFFVIALSIKNEKLKKIWFAVFLSVAFVLNVVVIIDYFSGNKLNAIGENLVFYNRNHFGYYVLVETVCAMALYSVTEKTLFRILSIAVYATGLFSLTLVDTLGCTLAVIFGAIFTVIVLILTGKFRLTRMIVLALTSAAVILILLFVPTFSGTTSAERIKEHSDEVADVIEKSKDISAAPGSMGAGRLDLWRRAVRCTLEKPLFGYGLADMREQLTEATGGRNNTVHNEFFEYSSNSGIPALGFYLAFVMAVFIRGAKNRKRLTNVQIVSLIASFAYLASSFFGVTMFYTAPYLFILLGFGYFTEKE